jgi:transcriptional regulator
MKIKCPMCEELFENRDSLSHHLRDHNLELPYEYAELIFKIHEKREELKTEKQKPEHFTPVESQLMINVLNYLLDDKK